MTDIIDKVKAHFKWVDDQNFEISKKSGELKDEVIVHLKSMGWDEGKINKQNCVAYAFHGSPSEVWTNPLYRMLEVGDVSKDKLKQALATSQGAIFLMSATIVEKLTEDRIKEIRVPDSMKRAVGESATYFLVDRKNGIKRNDKYTGSLIAINLRTGKAFTYRGGTQQYDEYWDPLEPEVVETIYRHLDCQDKIARVQLEWH